MFSDHKYSDDVLYNVSSYILPPNFVSISFNQNVYFFFNHSFWPYRYGFLTFPYLWEISFSCQMKSGTVSWLLGLDRIFK